MPPERAEFTVLQPILTMGWVPRTHPRRQHEGQEAKENQNQDEPGDPKCIDQGLKVKGQQGPR